MAPACVSTFTIYTTYSLDVRYSGGKLLIPICATLYGGNKNGLVNIQKQMLERWSEMTCSERETNWDPRDENEADMQEAGSIPEREPHSKSLEDLWGAGRRPVISLWWERRGCEEMKSEVRRSSLSGACRDLQAIAESLDLIRGEVCNPWKISELCQVRQRSSSYYKWSCASSSVAKRTPVHFQKGTCQVPEEQIGSARPLETAVRGRALKGVSGWVSLVSANDKSVKISIVLIQVQMLERNSRSASRDFK